MRVGLMASHPTARVAVTARGRVVAFMVAITAIVVATMHRAAGYASPYHAWFREFEKHHLGLWAPCSIEHLVGGFGCVAALALYFSPSFGLSARNRLTVSTFAAVLYIIGSTIFWTYVHYAASGDPAKLAEMSADVIGALCAILWLSWPQALSAESPASA